MTMKTIYALTLSWMLIGCDDDHDCRCPSGKAAECEAMDQLCGCLEPLDTWGCEGFCTPICNGPGADAGVLGSGLANYPLECTPDMGT